MLTLVSVTLLQRASQQAVDTINISLHREVLHADLGVCGRQEAAKSG